MSTANGLREPPPPVRVLVSLGGALALVGATLVLAVPVFGLRSSDCGALSCALVQLVGKLAAGWGIALAAATLAVGAALDRRPAGAVIAALIALPAGLLPFATLDVWNQQQAGLDQPRVIVAAAGEYAMQSGECGAGQPRLMLINGRHEWATVRATWPDDCQRLILLRRDNGLWSPRAIAPAFSRDTLLALGAPTNIARDAQ